MTIKSALLAKRGEMLSILHNWERDNLARNEVIMPAAALYQAEGEMHVVFKCPLCHQEHTTTTEAPFGLVRFSPTERCKHKVSAVIDGGTPAFGSVADYRRYTELERKAKSQVLLARAQDLREESDTLWRYAMQRVEEEAAPE